MEVPCGLARTEKSSGAIAGPATGPRNGRAKGCNAKED
jgi:hypothetical protein